MARPVVVVGSYAARSNFHGDLHEEQDSAGQRFVHSTTLTNFDTAAMPPREAVEAREQSTSVQGGQETAHGNAQEAAARFDADTIPSRIPNRR